MRALALLLLAWLWGKLRGWWKSIHGTHTAAFVVVAALPTAPVTRWAALRPLVYALIAFLVGVAVLWLPHHCRPEAAASLELSSPQALRSVWVGGAASGAVSATVVARGFFFVGAAAEPGGRRQTFDLTLPVATYEACLRVARALGAGCGRPATRAIEAEDVAIDALPALRLTTRTAAGTFVRLEASDHNARRLHFGAADVRATFGCTSAAGRAVIRVAGRRHVIVNPCRPSLRPVVLNVRLQYARSAELEASSIGTFDLDAHGRSARISAVRPTVVMDGKATTLMDATASAIDVGLDAPNVFRVRNATESALPVVLIAIPKASRIDSDGHGDLRESRFDQWRDYLFSISGVLFGVAASLLTTLRKRKKRVS